MFVKMWMTQEVITVDQDTPILEARNLMKENCIRRLPVLKHGQLAGMVTEGDIQEAGPSDANSLNMWELNYLLAKTCVKDVMTRRADLSVISPDDAVENAALIMRERKVSGLPVMDHDQLVGIITESDLFKILLNALGVFKEGARLTLALPNEPDALAPVLGLFKKHGIHVLSTITSENHQQTVNGDDHTNVVVLRIDGYEYQPIVEDLKKNGVCILDARN